MIRLRIRLRNRLTCRLARSREEDSTRRASSAVLVGSTELMSPSPISTSPISPLSVSVSVSASASSSASVIGTAFAGAEDLALEGKGG